MPFSTIPEALEDFRDAWGQAGRTLSLRCGGEEFHGVAEQVDDSGHLHLRLADGSARVFASGEIDFPAVFAALRAAGYHGGVHVELSRHSHDGVRAAQQAFEFLHRLGRDPVA